MQRFFRPWGFYENHFQEHSYKLKRLVVKPNSNMSLQYHYKRCEHWVVVQGYGKIILGEDNLHYFKKWKNSADILDKYSIYVYPRNEKIDVGDFIIHDNLKLLRTAPKIDISSTKIRDYLSKGIDVEKYLPKESFEYIIKNKYFIKS